jgi:ACS family glucarate transporter-like MFS transporter
MLMSLNQATGAVMWLSLAILGADMTLSPSWSHWVDLGGPHFGAVSGTMNMAGKIGSFLTALAFPYLEMLTGTTDTFFYVAAALNLLAIFLRSQMSSNQGVA